ncbi:MAG: hypothetical protein EA403_16365 [Spirochaetaceae bacterium]|nr:MAG: hypothetical protein EA403_16365 [Spirochaetaceae bacterium]
MRLGKNTPADPIVPRVIGGLAPFALWLVGLALLSCADVTQDPPHATRNDHGKPRPACLRSNEGKVSFLAPVLADGMASEWTAPIPVDSINTKCLEDAVQISACGQRLYFMFAEELLADLGGRMLSFPNGTYVAERTGDPDEFSHPTLFELGLGVDLSLDGKPIIVDHPTHRSISTPTAPTTSEGSGDTRMVSSTSTLRR